MNEIVILFVEPLVDIKVASRNAVIHRPSGEHPVMMWGFKKNHQVIARDLAIYDSYRSIHIPHSYSKPAQSWVIEYLVEFPDDVIQFFAVPNEI